MSTVSLLQTRAMLVDDLANETHTKARLECDSCRVHGTVLTPSRAMQPSDNPRPDAALHTLQLLAGRQHW